MKLAATRSDIINLREEISRLAVELKDLATEIRLPKGAPEQQVEVSVSLDRLADANCALARVIKFSIANVAVDPEQHLEEPLPSPGPQLATPNVAVDPKQHLKERLPSSGPQLGNRALSQALNYLPPEIVTYGDLARMTLEAVRRCRGIGNLGVRGLEMLLASKGLHFNWSMGGTTNGSSGESTAND